MAQYDLSDFNHVNNYLEGIGIPVSNWSRKLMARAALTRGLIVQKKDGTTQTVLSNGKKEYTWKGGRTTFNSRLARRLSTSKDAAAKFLRAYDVPMPEGALFRTNEAELAWDWAQGFLPVVVKPNDGNQGTNVFPGIQTKERFIRGFNQVGNRSSWVRVEEHLPGTEHRCLVVDGKFIAATRRRAASVVGDGRQTIAELVEQKNLDRGPIHISLQLGEIELEVLESAGLTPESIPAEEERVYLRKTSNIHTGGDAIDATDSLTAEEIKVIEDAARRLPGLRLGGFDVLLPRAPEETEIYFIEINQAPMISMHHFPWEGQPRDVAGAIVEAMFPSTNN